MFSLYISLRRIGFAWLGFCVSPGLSNTKIPRNHYETVGIQITNVYWPVKLGSRPTLFKLELWDAGEAGLKRYNHILPACKEGVDGIFVCFSSTDRGSWVELPQLIIRSAQMADRAAVFAIATRFDQHAHSEISEPEIEAFEAEHGTPVIRMSNVYTPDKDELREIAPTLNFICDKLWKRDQELLTVK
ncbi:ciliogenesis and planar polarity effector 2-like isoform X2 [Oratosquilla oratoria]|uniref:ciliogenesis and planar polarity effector 2-like isoform X2 n=1 Tax=Oratosquilla oratoria TaxID=337810 RepID=UPI003F7622D6